MLLTIDEINVEMERRFEGVWRKVRVMHSENCLQVTTWPVGHGGYRIVTRWRTPIVISGVTDLDLIERVVRSGESNTR